MRQCDFPIWYLVNICKHMALMKVRCLYNQPFVPLNIPFSNGSCTNVSYRILVQLQMPKECKKLFHSTRSCHKGQHQLPKSQQTHWQDTGPLTLMVTTLQVNHCFIWLLLSLSLVTLWNTNT